MLDRATRTRPGSFRNVFERRLAAGQVVRARTGVAAEQLSAFLADSAELHVLVLFVDLLVLGAVDLAVRARPLSFWSFVQFGIEAAQVVSARTGVAKNDLATLLANLAILLKNE